MTALLSTQPELFVINEKNFSSVIIEECAIGFAAGIPFINEGKDRIRPMCSVNLEILETPPAIKGATASGRTKTARLSTGVEIQVPEYLETGEIIKVNTETSKFMSRA